MSESIIERITRGNFWQFHGGIHPPEQKTLSSTKPIRLLPLPELLIIPLQQHIGRQGDLLVTVGDKVLKGQPLTQSNNPMAVPVHAPTSGTINKIEKSVIAHPSGLSELCLFLQPDGEDTWLERNICEDFSQLEPQDIIQKIAQAGIAGMGGAGFPTHIKVNAKPEINFLIINAAECEPYITADDLLMREHSESIVDGIKILDQLLTPAFILIGIEDNKPEAIQALKKATASLEKINVCVLPTKYPTGGEKQLIKILTGKEVTSGSLPIHSGIVVQNVATCFAIADAIINDTPLLRRVVTVTGQALSKPQNVWALLGTPVSFLLTQCGYQKQSSDNQKALIMGGPMMGFSLASDDVPIVKTSNCILAPSIEEMPSAFDGNSKEVECIRCGQCAEVCPSQLLPQELQWSAKAKDHQQLKALNLFDCIDCGACAYVCPSQIPLVQYYRVAKAEIRQQQALDNKAEKAKARFEARKARLAKEKIARELKHKKAAQARKAAMNKNTAEGGSAKSAVAAALARVKAKKAAGAKTTVADDASKQHEQQTDTVSEQQDKKAKVAAAIARAKAKKLAQAEKPHHETNKPEAAPKTQPLKQEQDKPQDAAQEKKARIAAAIAKAKAKKRAQSEKTDTADDNSVAPTNDSIQEHEPKHKDSKEIVQNSSIDKSQEKKARIAAAVAKAKAKKLAKAQANQQQTQHSESE